MGTLNEKLEYLKETKSQIKEAIISKGQEVSSSDTFRSYASKISAIDTVNNEDLTVNPMTSVQTFTPTQGHTGFGEVNVNAVTSAIDSNIQAGNIKQGVEILGVTGEYEGAQINNQDKTITTNGTYTADSGYTGLGEVTVNVVGEGSEIEAKNYTGSDILEGDKVWINQGATTSTLLNNRSSKYDYGYYMFDNPNKLYWFGSNTSSSNMDGIYIANINEDGSLSSFTKTFSISFSACLLVDEYNNLILDGSSGELYDLNTDTGYTYKPSSGRTYRRFNKNFVFCSNNSDLYKLSDSQELLATYQRVGTNTTFIFTDYGNLSCIIDEATMIGTETRNSYLSTIVLNNETNTYTITPTSFSGYVIGCFKDPTIIFTRTNRLYSSESSLKCYRYTNNQLELIDPTELPSNMALCYSEGCRMFVNGYTKTFTAYLPSSKKLVVCQYVNGEWVDISPAITTVPAPVSGTLYSPVFSISSDHTRMIYNGDSSTSDYCTLYIYNLATDNRYIAVPYLSANSNSATGTALANIAVGSTGTVKVGAKITPTGSITITENGTHDVTDYAEAVVNVTDVPAVVESLSITPSTSQQTFTPASGVDGYAPVNVSAVDSTIDNNITAENIRSGVEILGVEGTYEGTVINNQNKSVIPSAIEQQITADSGYTGLGTVTVSGDSDLVSENIKSGVNIFGVVGNVVESNNTTTTITPTTSLQMITPDSPYNGFSSVTVDAVTNSIDKNIAAGNIKKDVTILGVTGTLEEGTAINNQDISVTTDGSYTADAGYTGLGTVTVTAGAVASAATQNEIAEELMLINDGATTFTLTVSPTDATPVITSTTNSVVLTPSSSSGGVSVYSISVNALKTYSYSISKEGYVTSTGTINGGTASLTVTLVAES